MSVEQAILDLVRFLPLDNDQEIRGGPEEAISESKRYPRWSRDLDFG